jgi:hypothetical protein
MSWLNRWNEKRKEERKLRDLLDTAKFESHQCFLVWHKMLYAKSKTTVLEAKSNEELSQKWEKFHDPINNCDGRLGSLWSIEDKKFSVDKGTFYLMIQYRQFSLRSGCEKEDYQSAIEEYERCKAREDELVAKLKGI